MGHRYTGTRTYCTLINRCTGEEKKMLFKTFCDERGLDYGIEYNRLQNKKNFTRTFDEKYLLRLEKNVKQEPKGLDIAGIRSRLVVGRAYNIETPTFENESKTEVHTYICEKKYSTYASFTRLGVRCRYSFSYYDLVRMVI